MTILAEKSICFAKGRKLCGWFVVWWFSTVFQFYRDGQCTYPCFPGDLLPVPHTKFFPSHWQFSNKTILKTTDRGERGMNPIINPRKEYWQRQGSNQQPPVLVCNATDWPMGLDENVGGKGGRTNSYIYIFTMLSQTKHIMSGAWYLT